MVCVHVDKLYTLHYNCNINLQTTITSVESNDQRSKMYTALSLSLSLSLSPSIPLSTFLYLIIVYMWYSLFAYYHMYSCYIVCTCSRCLLILKITLLIFIVHSYYIGKLYIQVRIIASNKLLCNGYSTWTLLITYKFVIIHAL